MEFFSGTKTNDSRGVESCEHARAKVLRLSEMSPLIADHRLTLS